MRVLTLPNLLTLLRILVLPILAIAIHTERIFLGFSIIIFAGLSDILDGWIARQYRQQSSVGKLMDPVADKIFLCVALLFLIERREFPISPTLASLLLVREFLATGLRAVAASEGLIVQAGMGGKIKMFFQYVGLSFFILGKECVGIPTYEIGLGCLWFSVYLSYKSLWDYMRTVGPKLQLK